MKDLFFRVTVAAAAVFISIAIVKNTSIFKFARPADPTSSLAPISNTIVATKDGVATGYARKPAR